MAGECEGVKQKAEESLVKWQFNNINAVMIHAGVGEWLVLNYWRAGWRGEGMAP